MSSMQVTPGFGTSVATELKGNAHHQRVIAHDDLVRSSVTPPVSNSEYANGVVVGSEMVFSSVARFAGDVSRLEAVQIGVTGQSVLADLDLVLYSDALNATPANAGPLVVQNSELRNILAVVRIKAEDYKEVGGQKLAVVAPDVPVLLQAPGGASSVRGVLVARGPFKPELVDSVTISLIVRRS